MRDEFSRSSLFRTFRPPGLFATPVSPAAAAKCPQGSRDFYTRADHASLPLHASSMLAVWYRQLTAEGLAPSQTCSHVGRYQPLSSSGSHQANTPVMLNGVFVSFIEFILFPVVSLNATA